MLRIAATRLRPGTRMLGPVGARALSSARPTLVARAAVALQRRRNTDPIRTARPLSTEADGDAVNVLPTSKAWKAFMDDGEGAKAVYWTAAWCGPCKQISPEYARLSQQYSDIAFAKVDVDVCEEAAQTAKISSMPTFQFFKFGEFMGEFAGASPDQLQLYVEKVNQITEEEYKSLMAQHAEDKDV